MMVYNNDVESNAYKISYVRMLEISQNLLIL